MKDLSLAQVTDIKQFADVLGQEGFEGAQPSDNLEIVYITNWQVVAKKGDFALGETVIYIAPDAAISDSPRSKWADEMGIRRYLGSGGRVKTIKLRGVLSNGIVLKISDFGMPFERMVELGEDLPKALGVTHWEAPVPKCMFAKWANLPGGVVKSDEENFQSLDNEELHLGERCILTLKKDGCSGALQYDPQKDTFEFCSRSMTLKEDQYNHYINALTPYKEQVKAIANWFGERCVLRGEICGQNINANGANEDSKGVLKFFMYGFHFPDNENKAKSLGWFGSGRHFTSINTILRIQGLEEIPTVPLVKYENKSFEIVEFEYGKNVYLEEFLTTISMDMLRYFETSKDVKFEGVVLNHRHGSYKAKNAPYDMRAHKH